MAGSNEVNESKVIPLHCSINRRPYSFPLDFFMDFGGYCWLGAWFDVVRQVYLEIASFSLASPRFLVRPMNDLVRGCLAIFGPFCRLFSMKL